MIIIQPKKMFLGVVFDVDHDFEGPRAPKAHLDTPEEAALQMAAYEAKLAEGIDPWNGARIRSSAHKRGQVRSIPMLPSWFPCPRVPHDASPLAGTTANED